MAQQVINVGLVQNDGTGDTLRTGAQKINQNFSELYSAIGSFTYTPPIASTNTLGSVRVGTGLTVTIDGTISTEFDGNYANLTNKPTLFSGNYNDLTNKPTLFNGNYNNLSNKPTLFSGSYTDLTDRPALSTVAITGSYDSLTNKPFIPSTLTDLGIQDGQAGTILSTDGLGNFTFVPGTSYDQSLNTTDTVQFDTVITNNFVTSTAGVPTISSSTNINLTAANAVVVTGSPFRVASFTTLERDAIDGMNGDIIYNTTTNKFQGYQSGTWVDLS